jgi:hypothetical protein
MQIKSKCAWCEITDVNEKNVSHGICKKCAEKFKKEIVNSQASYITDWIKNEKRKK